MDEEKVDVEATEEAVESLPEETPEVIDDVKEESPEEPLDENGIPVKNRIAEAKRKAKKLSQGEAESALLSETPAYDGSQEDAVRIVESIAEQKVKKALEPMLARQFLADHPDAATMIEDINRVRSQHPELSGIENLEVAYKVAKADRQDEIIRQQVERRNQEALQTKEKATQAAIEGTGKSKSSPTSLADQIASAGSIEELEALQSRIQ